MFNFVGTHCFGFCSDHVLGDSRLQIYLREQTDLCCLMLLTLFVKSWSHGGEFQGQRRDSCNIVEIVRYSSLLYVPSSPRRQSKRIFIFSKRRDAKTRSFDANNEFPFEGECYVHVTERSLSANEDPPFTPRSL